MFDYTSVAQMKLQTLKLGQTVTTQGYYTPNDGGGAQYLIVAAGTGTDDGGSYHDLVGVQAELIPDDVVRVTQFGAIANDTDVSDQIQAAVDFCAGSGYTLSFPQGENRYRITKTINLPINIDIQGESHLTNIFAESGGTYTSNFAFLWNTTDTVDAIVTNPNFKTGSIRNLSIDAGDNLIKMIAFSGSPKIEDITARFFAQFVYGSTQFNDHVLVRRCNFSSNVVNATYAVELENLGDGVVLDQLQIANVANDPLTPQRSVRMIGVRAKIMNCLYGDVFLTNMQGSTTIENCGQDGGVYIFERSHVSLKNSGMSATPIGTIPITFANDGVFLYSGVIEDLTITHDINRSAYEANEIDLKTSNGYIIDIKNVTRNIANGSSPAAISQLGFKVEDEGGTPISDFNNLSHFYSTRSTIMDQKVVGSFVSLELPGATLNYFSSLGPFGADTWDIATGTYYYLIQPYWDVDKSVSRDDGFGERNIALTSGGDAASLTVGTATYPPSLTARVYRGTATNTYDNYADVPIVDAASLVDNGNSISGVPWISRTAGAKDAATTFNISGYSKNMNIVEVIATATPSAGNWIQGDKIWATNPTAAGKIGWVCTTAGAPGTWKQWGAIDA